MGLRERLREVARLGRHDPVSADPPGILDAADPPVAAPHAGAGTTTHAVDAVPPARREEEWPVEEEWRVDPASLAAELGRQRHDLAGLVLEMARLGRFNHPLVERRAFEALELDERLAAAEAGTATGGGRRAARRARRAYAAGQRSFPACRAAVPADANYCA